MSYLNRITSEGVTRRNFVAASAAAATLAAFGLTSCVDKKVEPVEPTHEHTERDLITGTWVPAACWHNCGGRCVNKALVRDGVIIRQKTDDYKEDSYDNFQQRACVRGRAQRMQTQGADRLRYPMKRKNWQPGGGANSNGALRGKDEWERISWDQAAEYIISETQRIYDTYGAKAILGGSGQICSALFNITGGCVTTWNTSSYGSWYRMYSLIGMHLGGPALDINDRYDWVNFENIIFLSVNPAWSSGGSPIWLGNRVKQAGVKTYFIDPMYSETCSFFGGTWIPCRPSSDQALLIGIAYAMLEMDMNGKEIIDWDFLDRCTIGFDADHMPDGEDPTGNFKDYLLGTYDGVPKNQEWASKRCCVSVENINTLASVLGKKNKTGLVCDWASARTQSSESVSQLIMTLGCMGGHFGKSGHMCGICGNAHAFNGGPKLITSGSSKMGTAGTKNTLGISICGSEGWAGVLNGSYTVSNNLKAANSGEVIPIEPFKEIIHDTQNARLQTYDGQVAGIEIHREAEFVVSVGQFETTNCRYADIVLPLTTYWENPAGGLSTGNRETIILYRQVVEPKYECKSDREIGAFLLNKMGLDGDGLLYSVSDDQGFYNTLAGTKVTTESGEKVNMLTITADEIKELNAVGEPQEGLMPLKEFFERGCYHPVRSEGDGYTYINNEAFCKDPENNKLTSESGKFEIYCRQKKLISQIGYGEPLDPIPSYMVAPEGYEATFADFEAGTPGEYPFQVYNPHYLRRSHTVFNNVLWLREAWPNPVFINSSDAAAKNISEGDTVLITSPYGKSMRQACVTDRIMPGVLGLPHGSWVDVDESTGIDKAGSDNYLLGNVPTGQGTSSWNTGIAKIEKYNTKLTPDCELPQRNHWFE